jgi:uncharacterized protein (DUF1697 family)
MNVKMPELQRALEAAGFRDVRTLLSSGNVVFTSATAKIPVLEQKVEKAMTKGLGRTFLTIVRPIDALEALLDRDGFARFGLYPSAKRVVTFLREPPRSKVKLPIELFDACIHEIRGTEVLSSYVPGPRGPVFMTLIEKTFGQALTTRTWDTVGRVLRAGTGAR